MGEKRMARDVASRRRAGAKRSSWSDEHIIAEYERGCMWAGRLLCAMFLVMTIKVVVFG